jgi:hypothetical protein
VRNRLLEPIRGAEGEEIAGPERDARGIK